MFVVYTSSTVFSYYRRLTCQSCLLQSLFNCSVNLLVVVQLCCTSSVLKPHLLDGLSCTFEHLSCTVLPSTLFPLKWVHCHNEVFEALDQQKSFFMSQKACKNAVIFLSFCTVLRHLIFYITGFFIWVKLLLWVVIVLHNMYIFLMSYLCLCLCVCERFRDKEIIYKCYLNSAVCFTLL